MQERALKIQAGVFLVKYESADDVQRPPTVTISLEKASKYLAIICPPDGEGGVLSSPGGCLVVTAAKPGGLRIRITPSTAGGSSAARVQLIPLSAAPAPGTPVDMSLEPANDSATSDVRLMGHVAGVGDVEVRGGQWIAGPTSPSRVEGLTIYWPGRPRGIDLRYSVRVGGPQPTSTPMVEAGTFAGSRGRALPLVAATMELSGAKATDYQLAVDAIFLGSPQTRVTGQRVILSGPTGREPLVGIRVRVESVKRDDLPVSEPSLAPRTPSQAPGLEGRKGSASSVPIPDKSSKAGKKIRVFRGGASQRTNSQRTKE